MIDIDDLQAVHCKMINLYVRQAVTCIYCDYFRGFGYLVCKGQTIGCCYGIIGDWTSGECID